MLSNDNIKNRLIKFIDNEGVNQAFICKKCGIATSSLSRFKTGTYCPSQKELKKIADYLSVRGY